MPGSSTGWAQPVRSLAWAAARALAAGLLVVALPVAAHGDGGAATPAGAARAAEPAITAERLRPGEHLKLTGRLDHPAWQRAPAFSGFVGKFPTPGSMPAHPTEVRVLYDDEAIYVGVRSDDPAPSRIRPRRRGAGRGDSPPPD